MPAWLSGRYLSRLLPASHKTALIAAIAHAVSVAFASASVGAELIYVALLSYIIAFVAAVPVGMILLLVVGYLRLGLASSLLLFLFVIQIIVFLIIIYLFEISPVDFPWQYATVSLPASLAAWWFSVYSAKT